MDDEHNWVVFFESTVTGERYYGAPMTLAEAQATAGWGNRVFPTILQWVERIPTLEMLGLDLESEER
jgi:hypothetical protein